MLYTPISIFFFLFPQEKTKEGKREKFNSFFVKQMKEPYCECVIAIDEVKLDDYKGLVKLDFLSIAVL